MKINFSQQLVDFRGEPMTDNGKPLTLERVCTHVLVNDVPNVRVDGLEKHRRHELAVRIIAAGSEPFELMDADVTLLRNLVENYPALIMVPAHAMLKAE